ncbi:dioxygenase, partial [Streptomyces albidoflavus]
MPALYLSHGAPPLADDPVWPGQLAAWSAELPRPTAILMVSAHWEEAPLALGAVRTLPLVHDFWGFPERYYRVEYAAPGAPALADSVRGLLAAPGTPVQDIPDRGLDHGAYVPLVEMYPDADIPVLQMSLPTLDPRRLMETGRRLAPLRDEGVLIVGSGFFTHNLAALRQGGTPSWSAEFDDWGRAALDGGDIDTLLD